MTTQTRWDMVLFALLIVLTGLLPDPASAQAPAGLAPVETHPSSSPEQQLVERYAPIVYLKRQRFACDTSGEPYTPLPVEAILGDPQVILRLDSGADDASFDPIITTGPGMEDIAFLGDGYYLDFPGYPLEDLILNSETGRFDLPALLLLSDSYGTWCSLGVKA